MGSWKDMPDGREKYQAYLCSREWSEIRERVRKRSGGICERCVTNRMDHVHHLTYERKYAERLDDLQAQCKPCHDFTHAKSNIDPARNRPVFVDGIAVRKFYLAGKITKTTWRSEIVKEWQFETSDAPFRSGIAESGGSEWRVVPHASECMSGVFLDYVGPWWAPANDWGHACATNGVYPHAYGKEEEDNHGMPLGYISDENMEWATGTVANLVREAIAGCDMVFAWIDSNDCLGTMFELGMAWRAGKAVVVASPTKFDWRETWLARQFAGHLVFADSAGEAWRFFWGNVVERKENWKTVAITSRRSKA